MNIGNAIEAMHAGYKVARAGWNGKDMFIVYMSPLNLPPYNTQGTERKVNDRTAKWIGEDTPLESLGYFAMFTADKKWQPGWLASQSDLLATDWEIVATEEQIQLPQIPPYKEYAKLTKQAMYPYDVGMSMEGVSISEMDYPEVGGMIAFDPNNQEDRWYISKAFFEANYAPA